MNWKPVPSAVVMAILVSGCVRSTHAQSGPATDQLRAIAAALRSDSIGKIETLHIPVDQETFGDITPQALQNGWHYKTTIRTLTISSREALVQALTTASVQPDSASVDLRQGVVFYSSRDETPIGAIYFDSTGHRGIVNSTPVLFETGLLTRLRHILPLSLE